MEIKGTAVKSIPEYVKQHFASRYVEWLEKLPVESRKIMTDAIYATHWYPMKEAAVMPTRQLSIFFGNDTKKAAWESGRFSAENALKGIYRIFIKVSSPNYIISRASKIFNTYYRPCSMEVTGSDKGHVNLHITEFPEPDRVVEYRIAGWMQKALEINNCKNVDIKLPQSLTRGHKITEIDIHWE